jgi:hypothetical protein
MIAGFFDTTTPMINFFAKAEGRVSSIKKKKYMARILFFPLCFLFFLSYG